MAFMLRLSFVFFALAVASLERLAMLRARLGLARSRREGDSFAAPGADVVFFHSTFSLARCAARVAFNNAHLSSIIEICTEEKLKNKAKRN